MTQSTTNGDLPHTARAAIERGSRLYLTGKPCSRGHTAPRKTLNNECVECARIARKERRKRISRALATANTKKATTPLNLGAAIAVVLRSTSNT
jgi:hypothetical protein